MNILSINTSKNDMILFQAKPKKVLTKELVKTMPAKDILDLSTATLKNQDINIVVMIRSKIQSFAKMLTSQYAYLKANAIEFSAKDITTVKSDKKKAEKIEKLLSTKIREEKIKRGMELNPNNDDFIPIEYLILPEEEKIHQNAIKMEDLITDKIDADRYKYQRAKHDRNLSRNAGTQISKMIKKYRDIEIKHELSVYTIDTDYETKKMYNKFAEKIIFAETKAELDKLQDNINITNLVSNLKDDLLELIERKRKLL